MLNIGCHLSAAKGYMNMGKEAKSIDANTFQFFTRNPRGGKAKAIDEQDVKNFLEFMKENNFSQILAHAPYTLNACSNKEETREFALNTMADDLRRMEYTPNQLYNFHPGSHVGQGVEIGIDFIVKQLNTVLTPDMTTTVLLETMAGKGTEIGRSFEELKEILDGVKLDNKMGVCMDTCHIYDGGYDIVNDLDGVLDEFDRIIGLDRLKAIHMNDSKILLQAIRTDTKKSVKAVSVLILWLRLSITLNYRVFRFCLKLRMNLTVIKKKFKCLENHILCKKTHIIQEKTRK